MASVSTKAILELTTNLYRVEAKLDIVLAALDAAVPTHSKIVFDDHGGLVEYRERGQLKGPLTKKAIDQEKLKDA